ncbi:MAG: ABC transporter ATP-binding protein [Brumimicrobium sp.]|nr:ABC transporter ATP-binding protein [Brumimicrobium sp.]
MLLTVDNIGFSYGNKSVFEQVSFSLKPGEIISIVGPSGAGKSTLLKCLAGVIDVQNGRILLENKEVHGPKENLIPGHPEIALVNQIFKMDDFFTVRENIANQLHHLTLELREQFTDELLSIFELDDLAYIPSKDISGGEQQRLTMACALAKEPKCLLLDEPFVHFDVHLSKKIGEYLRKLAIIRGMGVVLVTHNGVEALSWSDKILFMKNGKIIRKYTAQQAYNHPKNLYEGRYFGELNSVYVGDKQILFRPNHYSLESSVDKVEIDVKWTHSLFKGPFYANYFKLDNGKELVLYADSELESVQKVYV